MNNNKEESVSSGFRRWMGNAGLGNLNIPKNSKGSFCNVSDNIGYSSRSKYVA